MTLIKIKDFYPNYQESFGGRDFKDYTVYAGTKDEKIGSIHDLLVDESGRLRYFVVDTGFWVFGKKVLLPIGLSLLDHSEEKVYAIGLPNKDRVEELPEYDDDMVVDYDYEDRVKGIYRSPSGNNSGYERDEQMYELETEDRQNLKLYEERLIADKQRNKSGDVSISKEVETQTSQASVPVAKERIVIERNTPEDDEAKVVDGDETAFQSGEVARVAVYEETAQISKETFVGEEVSIRKEIERDTVTAEEELRREKLKVDTEGNPVINHSR